jgi:EAL domain-containing protein (putative c-di-GMP-specific phosphodiesterase class I)
MLELDPSATLPPFPLTRVSATERRRLRRDLSHMAGGDGLTLRYQRRRSLPLGTCTSVEASIVWPPRHRGVFSCDWSCREWGLRPVERDEFATGIGGWALRAACQAAAGWPGMAVSIGVAAPQLRDHAVIAQVAEALDRSGLAPEWLELSLTEAAATTIDLDALLTLSALRDLGVGLALNDFGADATSLSLLKRLPLTGLKLARVLLRGVPADREDAAIARVVIEAAHALGLNVVADGVDTEAQLAFLACCGCDEGQGELFGGPVSARALAISS